MIFDESNMMKELRVKNELRVRALLTPAAILVLGIVVPFSALEWWVSNKLFNYVSYSNSINLDKQLAILDEDNSWNVLALGSSEVRWGFMPSEFDNGIREGALHDVSPGVKSFNLGIDGFSPGLIFSLLDRWNLKDVAPSVKVLLVGVNVTENNTISDAGYIPGVCGALQKPVLTSSFASDNDLDEDCVKSLWTDRVVDVVEELSVVRYRKALRNILLPYAGAGFIGMQSTGLEHTSDGYQPHLSIDEAYDNYKSSWDRLLIDKANHPDRFTALPIGNYPHFLQNGSFFDRWRRFGEERDIEIVFYALPTNPMLIDEYDRRADYTRHSMLISEWAANNDVVFIDLGIKDDYERNRDFSDHRHLSQYGAPKFSRELGQALVRRVEFSRLFKSDQRRRSVVSRK